MLRVSCRKSLEERGEDRSGSWAPESFQTHFGRSAPVLGRSSCRKRVLLGLIRACDREVNCCARGRAHSANHRRFRETPNLPRFVSFIPITSGLHVN